MVRVLAVFLGSLKFSGERLRFSPHSEFLELTYTLASFEREPSGV